ncbi:DNA-3-methyladenine glycosylase 2 family protein [Demequina aurantiaca]|uniref:DNA-3-methyladenine glycosylase 2 family protein n=1 Tax=Demequina aurantiaca TaxID=676200 RepID=UPI003D32C8EC
MTTAPLDFDTCYSAVSSFDKRFDGQFFTAVRSTGIYCRPSCPARTPKRQNCTFYRTSAAAHGAGYRACKRCLPEAVPGSPEWNAREDVAARTMRLIADGVVDRDGVTGLAARLGYSERQLGRILNDELGAGPLQLARAQRAQNARYLLVATPLPASEVAFAAGFASIRQFNDTIGEVFGMAPTALRDRARLGERPLEAASPDGLSGDSLTGRSAGQPAVGTITLRLRVREPFNGAQILGWLAKRAVAGLEHVEDAGGLTYTRALRLDRGAAVMSLRAQDCAVSLTARLEYLDDLPALLARTRRLLDLDADPIAIDGVLSKDPRIAASVSANPGLRIPGSVGGMEMLARAIVGQQVSVAAARTAVERLVGALGEPLPDALMGHGVDRLFPSANVLADSARDTLTGPLARREALARAAQAVADGTLSLDVAQTRAQLTQGLESLRGIGPWTANYVALRVLGSPDVLLTGDSAVRAGAAALGLPDAPKALAEAAAAFSPWRSYLMMHLWRAASPQPKET